MRYSHIALLFFFSISLNLMAEESIPEFNNPGDIEEIPSNINDPLNIAEVNSDPESYGPTKRGDSLWNIALKVKTRDEISTQHMMLALYLANKQAFLNGNLNALKAGQTLRIPNAEELASVGRMNIAQEIQRYTNNPNSKSGLKNQLRKVQRQTDAQTAKNEDLRRKLEELENRLKELMEENQYKDERIESIKAQLGQ